MTATKDTYADTHGRTRGPYKNEPQWSCTCGGVNWPDMQACWRCSMPLRPRAPASPKPEEAWGWLCGCGFINGALSAECEKCSTGQRPRQPQLFGHHDVEDLYAAPPEADPSAEPAGGWPDIWPPPADASARVKWLGRCCEEALDHYQAGRWGLIGRPMRAMQLTIRDMIAADTSAVAPAKAEPVGGEPYDRKAWIAIARKLRTALGYDPPSAEQAEAEMASGCDGWKVCDKGHRPIKYDHNAGLCPVCVLARVARGAEPPGECGTAAKCPQCGTQNVLRAMTDEPGDLMVNLCQKAGCGYWWRARANAPNDPISDLREDLRTGEREA